MANSLILPKKVLAQAADDVYQITCDGCDLVVIHWHGNLL